MRDACGTKVEMFQTMTLESFISYLYNRAQFELLVETLEVILESKF